MQINVMMSALLAKVASFLALLCLFTNYSLVLILNDYAAKARNLVMPEMLLWSSLGMIAGGLLSPFFLPLPETCGKKFIGRKKPKAAGFIFIIIIMLPNIAMRSFGIELWLSSLAARYLIHFFTGMLYPVCCGLLLYSFLPALNAETANGNSVNRGSENLTGKYCVFLFALAWGSIILNRYIALPLFDFFGYNTAPLAVTTHAYNIITVLMMCISVLLITSLALTSRIEALTDTDKAAQTSLRQAAYQTSPQAAYLTLPQAAYLTSPQAATGKNNWRLIIILISLTVVYQIINTLMEMRFHLLTLTYTPGTEFLHFLALAITVVIMGFLAGFSIRKFLRLFLPFAIILLILIPCIILFDNNPPQFMIILRNISGSVVYRVMSAIFTVAIVEQYLSLCSKTNRFSGFWFYLLAGYFNITNIILIFSQRVGQLVPAGSGYTVLIVSIAAVAFMLLSIPVIFPHVTGQDAKQMPLNADASVLQKLSYDEMFLKYNLSRREIDVANLLLKEGLTSEEIGDRLCISPTTARDHISKICKKFGVKRRMEFMALFANSGKNGQMPLNS